MVIGLAAPLPLGLAVAVNVAPQRAAIGGTLAAVVDSQGPWEGRRVRVVGQVAELHDPGAPAHAVIEDASQNRSGLRDRATWRGLP